MALCFPLMVRVWVLQHVQTGLKSGGAAGAVLIITRVSERWRCSSDFVVVDEQEETCRGHGHHHG